ncbi:hypothetical protein T08_3286 [Trichinella sp. T8]|nr:hypothetical protein T08_3286 [Trichinella sp. T8]
MERVKIPKMMVNWIICSLELQVAKDAIPRQFQRYMRWPIVRLGNFYHHLQVGLFFFSGIFKVLPPSQFFATHLTLTWAIGYLEFSSKQQQKIAS